MPRRQVYDIRLEVKPFADAAQARAAARADDVDAAIVGGELVSEEQPRRRARAGAAGGHARRARGRDPAARGRVAEADARRALAPPALQARALGNSEDEERKGVAFIASLLLYMQLIIFGLAVATGVVEEKSSRVIEVLMAAVPPRALLAGKISASACSGCCSSR